MRPWGGYRNGRIPLAALEHVGRGAINGEPQYLHPAVAAAWRALVADVREQAGVSLAITEGFRPFALQQHYWNTLPYPYAATPGTSTHGWATAVDMANYARVDKTLLRRLVQARGFSFATGDRVKEPWHIEFIGSLMTWAGSNVTPITAQEEDDMYDAAAEARLRSQLELERPLKLVALVDASGAGGWFWVDREGNSLLCPSPAYATLAHAWGLSQQVPIRAIQQPEFDYITQQLLGPLNPRSELGRLEAIATLDEASIQRIIEGIDMPSVVLTEAQLEQVTEAARQGSVDGVRALSFVTVAAP